ncbi:MAG: hypothetical protein HOG08_00705 [Candidatus Magasanikbacteria bacterium]|nr:hypothetical protein [Candidatus Magasanikbacteria bacterium]
MNIPFTGLYQRIPKQLMRSCGYAEIYDQKTRKTSYVKTFGAGFYPRFHVYLDMKDNGFMVNLHLDQKKPSYGSNHAHNAEYDGTRVEQEGERIKRTIDQYKQNIQI